MRAASWLILVIVLLLGAWLTKSWWLPWLPPAWLAQLGLLDPATVSSATTAEPAKIYAWQDDQGRWNYTDTPPENRPYEVRQYREDMNVLPSQPPRAD